MNIIFFGANGGLGQWTWKAAIAAEHNVTAFVRSPETGRPHTFVCPGMMVDAPATPERMTTLDEPGGGHVGRVNMGDVAAVIVEDLEHGALLGHRVCVGTR